MEDLTFNFKLDKIVVESYSFRNPTQEFNAIDKGFLGFHFSFHFGINQESSIIVIKVNTKGSVKETEEELLNSIVSFIFQVKELDSLVVIEEGQEKMSLPNEVLEVLVSISISTLSGILFEKNKGTIIQNEIIPVADPKAIISGLEKE